MLREKTWQTHLSDGFHLCFFFNFLLYLLIRRRVRAQIWRSEGILYISQSRLSLSKSQWTELRLSRLEQAHCSLSHLANPLPCFSRVVIFFSTTLEENKISYDTLEEKRNDLSLMSQFIMCYLTNWTTASDAPFLPWGEHRANKPASILEHLVGSVPAHSTMVF